ncbi:MAG TPA: hypothetical protein VLC92_21190 [Rhodocyclaceae bacterium]|nr:hypothetical protein [Rhodocyclaceae bacterium]
MFFESREVLPATAITFDVSRCQGSAPGVCATREVLDEGTQLLCKGNVLAGLHFRHLLNGLFLQAKRQCPGHQVPQRVRPARILQNHTRSIGSKALLAQQALVPFLSIRPNTLDSVSFMESSYMDGISEWDERARSSPHEELRQNARRALSFLLRDMHEFRLNFKPDRKYSR